MALRLKHFLEKFALRAEGGPALRAGWSVGVRRRSINATRNSPLGEPAPPRAGFRITMRRLWAGLVFRGWNLIGRSGFTLQNDRELS